MSGEVELAEDSSIFFGASLRGDILAIKIGERSNIQDNSVLHTSRGRVPCIIEPDVTVGHSAIIHGATVKSGTLIGMGAVILDEAVIPNDSLVGARALVTEGKTFPERSLILGSPAKVVRELTDKEVEAIHKTSTHYVKVARNYKEAVSKQGS